MKSPESTVSSDTVCPIAFPKTREVRLRWGGVEWEYSRTRTRWFMGELFGGGLETGN